LTADVVVAGDVRIDDTRSDDGPVGAPARKPMFLEGVQMEVDGRTFTTERGIMSGSPATLRTDELEVQETADPFWARIHGKNAATPSANSHQ
jgi:hypothetical protein